MANEHILVVEDEEDILELLRYNLTKEGFRVTGVTSGEEALRSAKVLLPDLVLLDLMLPGMDGLEICRHLKQDNRTQHLPVVMVTAKGEEADIVTGLELGADDYITKPFSPRVLLARLRSVLGAATGRCRVRATPSASTVFSSTPAATRWSSTGASPTSRPRNSGSCIFWPGAPAGFSPGPRSSWGCTATTTPCPTVPWTSRWWGCARNWARPASS